VERAVYRAEDPERQVDALQFDPFHSPWAPTEGSQAEPYEAAATRPLEAIPPAPAMTDDLRSAVNAYERALLEEALGRNRFNQRATATALGLSYDQLRHAMKRHKLNEGETAA
ncbi:MAG: phage shock protein operon transcriptional activator, partial [Sphingomonadales bacterium]|nr:phage shock protein operon transcriptional activator [Sphingomonadales bacterium]